MSFFYPSSAASARSRRTRDKDGTGRASSISSHRRSKDLSKARDERSPPPKPVTPSNSQNSIYTQQNLALEHITDPTSSGSGTPSSATSPVLKGGQLPASTGGVYHLPYQLHTPAALQPYLEDAGEEEEEEDDDDDDEDEDESSAESINLPSDNEKDVKVQTTEKPKEAEKVPAKSNELKKSPVQCTPEDLTPQPKHQYNVPPSLVDQKMPGQFPSHTQEDLQRSAQSIQHQDRPKMSASSISLQDLPGQFRDHASFSSGSPTMLSRSTSNIEAPPPSLHERSFTPPALPQGIVPSRGSPAFISPLPVRPLFASHHMHSYQTQQTPQMSSQMQHAIEMSQVPPPMAYYMHHHPARPPMGFRGARHPSSTDTVIWDQQQQIMPHHSNPPQPAPPPALPQPSIPSPPIQPIQQNVEIAERRRIPEEENTLRLRRIQSVLPDFHALLGCYKEISALVGFSESAETASDQKQIRELKGNDSEKNLQIEKLKMELDLARNNHTIERNKLRLQIGNLDEEKKALAEDLVVRDQSYEDLRRDSQALREQFTALSIKATQEKNIMEAKISSLQEQLGTKTKAELAYTANLAAKDESCRRELASKAEAYKRDFAAKDEACKRECDMLSTRLADERKRNEENLSKLRSERDTAQRSRDTEVEKLRRSHTDAGDAWKRDREQLKNGWEKECREIKTQWEDHCRKMTSQHMTDRDELQRSWESSQQKQLKRNDQLEDERDHLRKELDRLRAAWSADKSKFARTNEEFRAMATRLQSEQHNMQKMMESWGEMTDSRKS
ncbi:MAG: hypothetical protein MMC23_002885 [Stictis urceolatum]|nr:hypothetical protein [Stictis urceolata]